MFSCLPYYRVRVALLRKFCNKDITTPRKSALKLRHDFLTSGKSAPKLRHDFPPSEKSAPNLRQDFLTSEKSAPNLRQGLPPSGWSAPNLRQGFLTSGWSVSNFTPRDRNKGAIARATAPFLLLFIEVSDVLIIHYLQEAELC